MPGWHGAPYGCHSCLVLPSHSEGCWLGLRAGEDPEAVEAGPPGMHAGPAGHSLSWSIYHLCVQAALTALLRLASHAGCADKLELFPPGASPLGSLWQIVFLLLTLHSAFWKPPPDLPCTDMCFRGLLCHEKSMSLFGLFVQPGSWDGTSQATAERLTCAVSEKPVCCCTS